jgi:hypothetical protein
VGTGEAFPVPGFDFDLDFDLDVDLDLDFDLGFFEVQAVVLSTRAGGRIRPGTFRRRFRVILPGTPLRTEIGFDFKVLTLRVLNFRF